MLLVMGSPRHKIRTGCTGPAQNETRPGPCHQRSPHESRASGAGPGCNQLLAGHVARREASRYH
eukprot:6360698-Amphidinium_carterae.1